MGRNDKKVKSTSKILRRNALDSLEQRRNSAPAALAVDMVVLTIRDRALVVLALERPDGALALPGGFVQPTESPNETAESKLREKTGLKEI